MSVLQSVSGVFDDSGLVESVGVDLATVMNIVGWVREGEAMAHRHVHKCQIRALAELNINRFFLLKKCCHSIMSFLHALVRSSVKSVPSSVPLLEISAMSWAIVEPRLRVASKSDLTLKRNRSVLMRKWSWLVREFLNEKRHWMKLSY